MQSGSKRDPIVLEEKKKLSKKRKHKDERKEDKGDAINITNQHLPPDNDAEIESFLNGECGKNLIDIIVKERVNTMEQTKLRFIHFFRNEIQAFYATYLTNRDSMINFEFLYARLIGIKFIYSMWQFARGEHLLYLYEFAAGYINSDHKYLENFLKPSSGDENNRAQAERIIAQYFSYSSSYLNSHGNFPYENYFKINFQKFMIDRFNIPVDHEKEYLILKNIHNNLETIDLLKEYLQSILTKKISSSCNIISPNIQQAEIISEQQQEAELIALLTFGSTKTTAPRETEEEKMASAELEVQLDWLAESLGLKNTEHQDQYLDDDNIYQAYKTHGFYSPRNIICDDRFPAKKRGLN